MSIKKNMQSSPEFTICTTSLCEQWLNVITKQLYIGFPYTWYHYEDTVLDFYVSNSKGHKFYSFS